MAISTPRAVHSSPGASPFEVAVSPRRLPTVHNPLIYWHLLSLDAPSVAMLWTWFIAKSCHVHLPLNAILAMGTAVWMLYAADRLLDSHCLVPPGVSPPTALAVNSLEVRHLFHRRHQQAFRLGIFFTSLGLAVLFPGLATESVRLYAVLGTLLVGYFALIHLKRQPMLRLPKEIAVGVFFSAATFIPTVARVPAIRLVLLPIAVLFCLACSLNCLFIYAWEHPAPFPEAHPATRLALRFLLALSCLTILGSFTLALLSTSWQLPAAVATAVALLLLLNAVRCFLGPTMLRAAADLCLLTPALFALAHIA